jgi:glycosyltransferase involved in cell wall biosynthesis
MFSGTGGTEELMVNGGGIIVPYLDIQEYAEAIFTLSQSESQRLEMGKILKKEVVEKYNSEVSCKKVQAIFEGIL